MTSRLIELALKKQRLQFESDQLRDQWRAHVHGLAPAIGAADQVRESFGWLRRHPEVLIGVGVAVVVVKPRAVWRWFKRGFVAWQFWRRGQHWLAATPLRRRT